MIRIDINTVLYSVVIILPSLDWRLTVLSYWIQCLITTIMLPSITRVLWFAIANGPINH